MTADAILAALDDEIRRRLSLEFGDDHKPEYRMVHSLFIASNLLQKLGLREAGIELNSIASDAGRKFGVLK